MRGGGPCVLCAVRAAAAAARTGTSGGRDARYRYQAEFSRRPADGPPCPLTANQLARLICPISVHTATFAQVV